MGMTSRDSERAILVVGATGDIGSEITRRLCRSGYRVAASGITEEQARDLVDELDREGLEAEPVTLDVTDDRSCAAAVRHVTDRFGRLDGLVNSAGVSYVAPVILGKSDEWERVLSVNTAGAFKISRAAIRPMVKARYGRLVHIGSISAQVGAPYNAIYSASKAGVAGLVRSLSLEVAGTGITVNAVQPGYVKTKLFAQTQGARARMKGMTIEEHEQDLIDDTPTGRLVTPEDVAALVDFLVSEESRGITGQTINVDGGRTAK